ncbi:unnamed protein product [Miscanthus lutarioriparius]|uniref:Uncharacterized protein n=1 Tax=Miscanthus lutarioriparius TaxID=422564 RepID=A0A811NMN0_9POAL|nr:unnamed protein product [Miscanthus lutarioriparius]
MRSRQPLETHLDRWSSLMERRERISTRRSSGRPATAVFFGRSMPLRMEKQTGGEGDEGREETSERAAGMEVDRSVPAPGAREVYMAIGAQRSGWCERRYMQSSNLHGEAAHTKISLPIRFQKVKLQNAQMLGTSQSRITARRLSDPIQML